MFLQSTLSEDVYMSHPPGFVDRDSPHFVCKLRKAIYGLKQAPRAWYHELLQYILSFGFSNSSVYTYLFIYNNHGCTIYLLVYVDYIIIYGNTNSATQDFITTLSHQFFVKDLSSLHYFLGIELLPHQHELFLS